MKLTKAGRLKITPDKESSALLWKDLMDTKRLGSGL